MLWSFYMLIFLRLLLINIPKNICICILYIYLNFQHSQNCSEILKWWNTSGNSRNIIKLWSSSQWQFQNCLRLAYFILCNIQVINSFQQLKIVKTAAFWVCLKLFSQFSHLHFVYFILILLILHFFNFQKKRKKNYTQTNSSKHFGTLHTGLWDQPALT